LPAPLIPVIHTVNPLEDVPKFIGFACS